MDPFHAFTILIILATGFSYINHRFFQMPKSVALMAMSLLIALLATVSDPLQIPVRLQIEELISGIDFSKVLLEGMLGLLLFAGALHIDINDLLEQKLEISTYATLGVLMSTFLIGSAAYGLSNWMGLGLKPVECLLFGALISPTDPIAVLGIMKSVGAPKELEIKIAGESLFNDGIGVVLFLVLLEIAVGSQEITARSVVILFGKEVAGGVLLGLSAGYLAYRLLKSVNDYAVEIMITLSLVIGGFWLGIILHVSAPIAMVIAGLFIGNHGRRLAMSDKTREHLDMFWELVDEILNAILFVLIGLEVLVMTFEQSFLFAGIAAIPIAVLARSLSIGIPAVILNLWRKVAPHTVVIMTWGGLRGGISVALALSLPASCNRELILTMSYVVVVFSILGQGLTIGPLIRKKVI